jgi:serine/threonine protein phosphatase PrpC
MEDAHAMMWQGDNNPFATLCLFDGHGSGEVSNLLAATFPAELAQAMTQGGSPAHLHALVTHADQQLGAFTNEGCTLCAVAVDTRRGRRGAFSATVVSVGDSVAFVRRGSSGKVAPITPLHDVRYPGERERVRAAGAIICDDNCKKSASGTRVLVGGAQSDSNGLDVSRTMGDFADKSQPDLPPEAQPISCAPFIHTFELDRGDTLFLSCDGLTESLRPDAMWATGSPLAQGARAVAEARAGDAPALCEALAAMVHGAMRHSCDNTSACALRCNWGGDGSSDSAFEQLAVAFPQAPTWPPHRMPLATLRKNLRNLLKHTVAPVDAAVELTAQQKSLVDRTAALLQSRPTTRWACAGGTKAGAPLRQVVSLPKQAKLDVAGLVLANAIWAGAVDALDEVDDAELGAWNEPDAWGNTPVLLAAIRGLAERDWEVLKYMLGRFAKVRAEGGALRVNAETANCMRYTLRDYVLAKGVANIVPAHVQRAARAALL